MFDPATVDCAGFVRELGDLRRELEAGLGADDIAHLRKLERWGRTCTAMGLATAGIAPNPLSAVALALGRGTRWMIMHHVAHRGYDKVPGIPARYTSKVFARGGRRVFEWMDWVTPEAWVYEHNVLHHSNTAGPEDPDLIERNTTILRDWPGPKSLRYLGIAALSLLWRPGFYGPNALRAWKDRNKPNHETAGEYDWATIVRSFTDPEYWRSGVAPYSLVHFVALPLLYAPLGPWAVWSAFWNSVFADILTNIHSLAVVLPNHCGDDMVRYDEPAATKLEWQLRQVISSVNYRTGGDLVGFLQLWLNYQIEHHIWPDMPMLKYREVQPRVKALCAKYKIPYVQDGLFARIKKMSDVVVGNTAMRRVSPSALAETA